MQHNHKSTVWHLAPQSDSAAQHSIYLANLSNHQFWHLLSSLLQRALSNIEWSHSEGDLNDSSVKSHVTDAFISQCDNSGTAQMCQEHHMNCHNDSIRAIRPLGKPPNFHNYFPSQVMFIDLALHDARISTSYLCRLKARARLPQSFTYERWSCQSDRHGYHMQIQWHRYRTCSGTTANAPTPGTILPKIQVHNIERRTEFTGQRFETLLSQRNYFTMLKIR